MAYINYPKYPLSTWRNAYHMALRDINSNRLARGSKVTRRILRLWWVNYGKAYLQEAQSEADARKGGERL